MQKQQIVVIGLGVFGETIATELTRLGHDVLGIDLDEKLVDRLADRITHAVIADVTDDQVLRELNVGQYDVGVVAIGRNIEATILATLHLRSLGVEKVWAKALTNHHHRILEKIGATRIIGPEFEIGMQVAQELNYPMVNNYIGLGDDEFVVEIIASDKLQDGRMHQLIEQTAANVKIVAIKRGTETHVSTLEHFELRKGDQIVLMGKLAELRKLANRI